MRFIVRKGDATSTGGEVRGGCAKHPLGGRPIARMGDPVYCPRCQRTGEIAQGNPAYKVSGQPVAGEGHLVRCACPYGSHTLIASQQRARMGLTTTGRSLPPAIALEEEEEEVEVDDGVTLRIGVFFDGTGNNLANSATVAQCFARDVELEEEAEEVRRHCARYGYDGQGNVPDNSYGNDMTNVARLYELYQDRVLGGEQQGRRRDVLKVYIDGIGTTAGQQDSALSQATGRYSGGVVARAEEAHQRVLDQIRAWLNVVSQARIIRLEFDLFGFSRGAAAARHFANDLAKGGKSHLAQIWPRHMEVFCDQFDWNTRRSLGINFIGLFDSVAAIVSVLEGNFSPANARYSGVNMRLAPGGAKKVVQLVARDERRKNFPLTRTDNDIVVPGAHSDVGGGYLPRMREKVLLTRPRSSTELRGVPDERSQAYLNVQEDYLRNRLVWKGLNLQVDIIVWSIDLPFLPNRDISPQKRVYAFLRCEREVLADLSLAYLRVMRELAIREGVPFNEIREQKAWVLPDELQGITRKLMAYAVGDTNSPELVWEEEKLLRTKYIHLSAHWNPAGYPIRDSADVMFIHRPNDSGKRSVYPNE
ncbi:PAAR domain-containing protein [Pseudomonas wadenswilerensis]|uniref:PAAR domain-containing protein n=1 Tax=Pseudomonas wadenswilerensis TaxID=1785161 RepID=UPI00215FB3E3|nr:DUF2235 domain-containing protein [Pseudomonas wadenswilerensis]UVM24220.1 DUF2235 domain-containing protein [Pseudomonas wadenswilerensis]